MKSNGNDYVWLKGLAAPCLSVYCAALIQHIPMMIKGIWPPSYQKEVLQSKWIYTPTRCIIHFIFFFLFNLCVQDSRPTLIMSNHSAKTCRLLGSWPSGTLPSLFFSDFLLLHFHLSSITSTRRWMPQTGRVVSPAISLLRTWQDRICLRVVLFGAACLIRCCS